MPTKVKTKPKPEQQFKVKKLNDTMSSATAALTGGQGFSSTRFGNTPSEHSCYDLYDFTSICKCKNLSNRVLGGEKMTVIKNNECICYKGDECYACKSNHPYKGLNGVLNKTNSHSNVTRYKNVCRCNLSDIYIKKQSHLI